MEFRILLKENCVAIPSCIGLHGDPFYRGRHRDSLRYCIAISLKRIALRLPSTEDCIAIAFKEISQVNPLYKGIAMLSSVEWVTMQSSVEGGQTVALKGSKCNPLLTGIAI